MLRVLQNRTIRSRVRVFLAFTLAEVLITLVIIGSVAALIIPPLINSSKNAVTLNAVKKNYNMLSNAFKLFAIEYNCVGDLGSCKTPANPLKGVYCAGSGMSCDTRNPLYIGKAIAPFLRYSQDCGFGGVGCAQTHQHALHSLVGIVTGNADNHGTYEFLLSDGTVLEFADSIGNYNCDADYSAVGTGRFHNSVCGYILADVDGQKGLSQYGRDIFMFIVLADGTIYPAGGPDFIYNYCDPKSSTGSGTNGFGCAYRILTENAINY